VDKQQQQEQQQPQEQEKQVAGFTIVSLDEPFFFYDSLVRRVWIVQDKRPIVRVTGSHQRSCVFGAISMEEKKKKKKKRQLFRQYDEFNGDTFLDYLKKIHTKFQKCYLFMDKASPHYTCKKVIRYFEDNKDTLIPVYLPTASPEFMVMEKVWNIAKQDLLVPKYYSSFADLKNKISQYFRTKRFNLNMRNYLLREVR
jgi:transposase